VRKLTLNINMRVQLHNGSQRVRFSKQLLEIGNGKVGIDNTNRLISWPNNFCTIKRIFWSFRESNNYTRAKPGYSAIKFFFTIFLNNNVLTSPFM